MTNDERFKGLYQRYYRRIVRFYVQSFHLSEEDAEDLAQDAFIRFYKGMDDYRGDAEWAYMETIARNVAFNRIRSQKTKKRSANIVPIDDPQVRNDPAAGEEPDYVEREVEAGRRRQMRAGIAALPAGQRETLDLWLQGYSYEEIATALRTTVDAVKSRLRDARKALRGRLGDAGSIPEEDV